MYLRPSFDIEFLESQQRHFQSRCELSIFDGFGLALICPEEHVSVDVNGRKK